MPEAIQFSEHLSALHLAFRTVQDVLKKERDCLATNRTIDLPNVTTEKNTALMALEKSISPLQTLVTHSNPESAFQNAIAHLQPVDQNRLTILWNEIKTLCCETQTQNEINGAVIAISLQNTRRLINLLHFGNDQNQTYDGTGKKIHSKADNGFIEA